MKDWKEFNTRAEFMGTIVRQLDLGAHGFCAWFRPHQSIGPMQYKEEEERDLYYNI